MERSYFFPPFYIRELSQYCDRQQLWGPRLREKRNKPQSIVYLQSRTKFSRDSHAKLVVIDDLTITQKQCYIWSLMHVPLLLSNAMLKVRKRCGMCSQHCMWGGGRGVPRVLWISYESLSCACLKTHKDTFVPRILSIFMWYWIGKKCELPVVCCCVVGFFILLCK